MLVTWSAEQLHVPQTQFYFEAALMLLVMYFDKYIYKVESETWHDWEEIGMWRHLKNDEHHYVSIQNSIEIMPGA